MFRILTCVSIFAAATLTAGCNSCNSCGGSGLFSRSSDRPPLFSRFRTASTSVVVAPGGGCCDGNVTGPYVPPVAPPPPGTFIPPPPPQPQSAPIPPIPRIDENGKQVPWDPKTASRAGIKTANDPLSPKIGN